MAGPGDGTGDGHAPVAFLDIFRRESIEQVFQESEWAIPICPKDEFLFGRSPDCKFMVSDPTVSNKHLRIHCIIFDDNDSAGILPLVSVRDLSANGTYVTRADSSTSGHAEMHMSKSSSVLLVDSDRLLVCPTLLLRFRYADNVQPSQLKLTSQQRRESETFSERYTITDQAIGSGGHGTVFVAIHKRTQSQLACKIVNIQGVHTARAVDSPPRMAMHTGSPVRRGRRDHHAQKAIPKAIQDAILETTEFREINILQKLDHPNIIHLEKVFWSADTIYIFQDLVANGDLFSFIEHCGGRVPDAESTVILHQILKGVEYLHGLDIVHRDLKPDNILLSKNEGSFRVIITDFGNARFISEDHHDQDALETSKKRMFSMVGTLEYAAPEIHRKNPLLDKEHGYSKAVDMWSVGLIASALLSGDVIFTNRNDPRLAHDPQAVILELASKCDLSVLDNPYTVWSFVAKQCKDFLRGLLVLDESSRLDIKQALAHPLFTNPRYASKIEQFHNKAIGDWVPRRPVFRVVEAVDIGRLSSLSKAPVICGIDSVTDSRSQPFTSSRLDFVRANLRNVVSYPKQADSRQLAPIGEETTPKRSTSRQSLLCTPMAPRKTKEPISNIQVLMQQMPVKSGFSIANHETDPIMDYQMTQQDTFQSAGAHINQDARIREASRLDSPQVISCTPPIVSRAHSQGTPGGDAMIDDTSPIAFISPSGRKRPYPTNFGQAEAPTAARQLFAKLFEGGPVTKKPRIV